MKSVRVIVICAFALASAAFTQTWKPGTKAPTFTANGSDGKSYSLASLTKRQPTLLYFIKDGCPVNHRAIPFYKQIASAYRGKVNVVGVINTNLADYKKWQMQYKTPFVSLLDPDHKIIKSYRVAASPWAVLVGRDGKVIKEWPGFSKGELAEMNKLMAAAGKTKEVTINLGSAPDRPMYG